MSLLHAIVSYNDVILSEHGSGDYSAATQTILSKIPPNDSKLSYAANNLNFHYIKSNNLVVLVVANEAAGRRVPFAFLGELEKRFRAAFTQEEIEDAPAWGMASFNNDIAKLMKHFVESPPDDPIKVAQTELANVKDIMVSNIESVLSRGERIDLLVSKTDNMSTQARAFRKRSTALRRSMWWRNVKVIIFGVVGAFLLLYFIIASFCGLALNHCTA